MLKAVRMSFWKKLWQNFFLVCVNMKTFNLHANFTTIHLSDLYILRLYRTSSYFSSSSGVCIHSCGPSSRSPFILVGLLSPSINNRNKQNLRFLSLRFYYCSSLYILNTFSCLGYQWSIAFLIVILVGLLSPSIKKRKNRILDFWVCYFTIVRLFIY